MSDSSQPHGLPASFLHPWDFPGKITGVGCHFLLGLETEMLEEPNSETGNFKTTQRSTAAKCSYNPKGWKIWGRDLRQWPLQWKFKMRLLWSRDHGRRCFLAGNTWGDSPCQVLDRVGKGWNGAGKKFRFSYPPFFFQCLPPAKLGWKPRARNPGKCISGVQSPKMQNRTAKVGKQSWEQTGKSLPKLKTQSE